MQLNIGIVIMASGFSARYGKNKLLEKIDGVSMIERAFDAVPIDEVFRTVVVTRFEEVKNAAAVRGFFVAENNEAAAGISSSIKKGILAAEDADGIVFCVADQPYLKRETVKKLISRFKEHPESIIVPVCNERTGNPCIFPSSLFKELMALEGDAGGKAVISKHREMTVFEEVDERELEDVDRP